jgi:hypothetical protein
MAPFRFLSNDLGSLIGVLVPPGTDGAGREPLDAGQVAG